MVNYDQKAVMLAKKTEATVLITGPTGSGKSTLAETIHQGGTRGNKPFVVVNLATLYEGTLEGELFGHERGAYTGATEKRTGLLQSADGGTVFLDEIGELPVRLQAKLLDFVQKKTLTPLGSNREIKVDARIIAATNQNLEDAVKGRRFREDLLCARKQILPLLR